MNKKDNIKLDVLSQIDDDIIEKQSIKRFGLLIGAIKPRGNRNKIFAFVSAAACFCIIVGIIVAVIFGGNGGKQVPIYQGMTISNKAPTVNGTLFADWEDYTLQTLSAPLYKDDDVVFIDDDNGNHYGNNKGNKNDSNAPGVLGGTYYAMKNEDIYIHIHLSNPDDFEILSFTLNGEKYSSNMFEYGSNLELLILKYNVGDINGLQEYTIDAIKYVDGEKIKDVRMDGDRTVKVLVNDDTQPLQFNATLHGFELLINPTWSDEFTGEKKITSLSLWDGEEKLRDLDINATVIGDLPHNKYLILKATYNDAGGTEQIAFYLFLSPPEQSEGLQITDGLVTGIGSCEDRVIYINMPIAEGAFSGNVHIKEVYMGDGVTSIGTSAFSGCTGLTDLVISGSVKTIKMPTFDSCTSLKTIVIKEGVETIESPPDYHYPDPGVFGNLTTLENVSLPNTLKYLGYSAFRGCTSLKSINIPGSVGTIRGYTFCDCTALESVTIGEGVTSIIGFAFSYCPIKTITLPSTVTSLEGAFMNCDSLVSVNIPSGVTTLNATFFDCRSLKEVNIPDTVTTIGNNTFSGCFSLVSINIPNSVTSIGEGAFQSCRSLVSINIPNSVTSIGEGAFEDCISLKELTNPNNLEISWGISTDQESIQVPSFVTKIPSFGLCGSNLQVVYIPISVTALDLYVFGLIPSDDDHPLTRIEYEGTVEQWNAISKNSLWDYGVGDYTVYCSNGNIPKS